jgi:hypothetical protein
MLHHTIVIDGGDADRVELYLPTLLKFEIDRQKKLEREQRIAEEHEWELKQEKEREERKGLRDVSMPAARLANAPSAPELSTAQATNPQGHDPRLMHPVYALAAAQKLIDNAAQVGADRDTRKRDEALGKKMLNVGILRKIAAPANAVAELDTLRQGMPHFGEVIDLVRGRLALASQSLSGPRIPPILFPGFAGSWILCPGRGISILAGSL